MLLSKLENMPELEKTDMQQKVKVVFLYMYWCNSEQLCMIPPQYAPASCKLTFDLLTLKWCPSHVWREIPLCQF